MFCLAFISLEPLGLFTLTRLGLASVEAIKKKSNRMNKISFNAPVCTSVWALNFLLMFIQCLIYDVRCLMFVFCCAANRTYKSATQRKFNSNSKSPAHNIY